MIDNICYIRVTKQKSKCSWITTIITIELLLTEKLTKFLPNKYTHINTAIIPPRNVITKEKKIRLHKNKITELRILLVPLYLRTR